MFITSSSTSAVFKGKFHFEFYFFYIKLYLPEVLSLHIEFKNSEYHGTIPYQLKKSLYGKILVCFRKIFKFVFYFLDTHVASLVEVINKWIGHQHLLQLHLYDHFLMVPDWHFIPL